MRKAHLACQTKLCRDFIELEFEDSHSASCLFSPSIGGSGCKFMLVYVDDLLVIAPSVPELDTTVTELKRLYELRMSDRVELFLGV